MGITRRSVIVWIGPALVVVFFGGLLAINILDNSQNADDPGARESIAFPGCSDIAKAIGESNEDFESDSIKGSDDKGSNQSCILSQVDSRGLGFALKLFVTVRTSDGSITGADELADKELECRSADRGVNSRNGRTSVACLRSEPDDKPIVEAGYIDDLLLLTITVQPTAQGMIDAPAGTEVGDDMVVQALKLIEGVAEKLRAAQK